jgi:16S rRNA (adenine1518-N6/adenine1519-N6)-dimethyltransferase
VNPRPRARKRLGQHFLSDPRILDRIVGALDIQPGETVIEIGPGRGALTSRLAARAARLIAIELDRDLAPALRAQFASQPHVEIVEGDVLNVDLGAIAGGPYALIGNVPYYITTPILFHALAQPRPSRAVFLMQREVADRLCATPGGGEYGALSINVQSVARVEQLFRVAPGSFSPPPTVDSSLVRVTPRADPVVTPEEEAAFRRFVQAAFAQRRKQLRAIIRSIAHISTAEAGDLITATGLSPSARPETLTAAAFASLHAAVTRAGRGR